jgi:hypothetical protein
MSIMMIMRWDGVSTADYDAVRDIVQWETQKPTGGIYHACAHDGTALRITDIWDTTEHYEDFVSNRLMPAVQQVGVTSQPDVEIYPVHAINASAYSIDMTGTLGKALAT